MSTPLPKSLYSFTGDIKDINKYRIAEFKAYGAAEYKRGTEDLQIVTAERDAEIERITEAFGIELDTLSNRNYALRMDNAAQRKVLEQALEALTDTVDMVRNEYDIAVELYGKYPTRAAKINGLLAGLRAHESAITAIQEQLNEH